jgi:ABC-type uncharacterized transport system permease subunit
MANFTVTGSYTMGTAVFVSICVGSGAAPVAVIATPGVAIGGGVHALSTKTVRNRMVMVNIFMNPPVIV